MLSKENVRERLQRIIRLADTRADSEVIKGEAVMGNGQGSFAATGFATGARFVRDMIMVEFNFLFEEDEDGNDS